MRSQLYKVLAVCLVLLMLAGTVYGHPATYPTSATGPAPSGQGKGVVLEPAGATGEAYYIVQLSQAPLASYRGNIEGLAATNPAARGQVKVDVNHPDSVAYLAYLDSLHSQFVASVEQTLGRSVIVGDHYRYAFNGMSMLLTPDEAAAVARLDGVNQLQRNFMRQIDTDNGPAWIGAPSIWDGSVGGGQGTQGEGIVVGVIDTGINMDNPSFADVGDDGYNHTNPLGAFVGWCNPADPDYDPTLVCNDKLIGVRSHPDASDDPEDEDGHGSHTASTAAGNHVDEAVLAAPTIVITRSISGVAPHANIIAYDACTPSGCALTALVDHIDQTIPDGVDVINYSIGSTAASDPWNDSDSLAFLGVYDAGVFAAVSAGNAGPGPGTIGSPSNSPWLTASGASTHNRAFQSSLVNMSGGNTTPPPDLHGWSISTGYGPAPIVYAGAAPYNNPLCDVFPANTFTNNEIVVCDRGTVGRVQKGQNVLDAGGNGMVLVEVAAGAGPGNLVADPHVLPAVHLITADGTALKTWLATGTNHMATITPTSMDVDDANGDIMASFSSRGPNTAVPNIIKPNITNPGVSILAAYKDPEDINVISGTSMASPHTAGSAALLRSLHPEWTPGEIMSVLMTTSITDGIVKNDGVTDADPFDRGAGRVQLTNAGIAGLVLDETAANFTAADPGNGGDPSTLNIASLANDECETSCSWTRTVSSTLDFDVHWDVTATAANGIVLTVAPNSFDLSAGGSQDVTITADVTGATEFNWTFGEVEFVPTIIPDHAPEVVLWDNGSMVNSPGTGPGGADQSVLQSVSLGMNTLGFGVNSDSVLRVSDNFTVTDPAGWTVNSLTFYAYQTNSGGTSTLDWSDLRIWDGPPNAGGSIIFGDITTNRLINTDWSGIYRVTETTLMTTTRPVMAAETEAEVFLPQGTYWADWSIGGTLASGPFSPPITINGVITTGNALQFVGADGWVPLSDTTDSLIRGYQGMPFIVEGTVGGPSVATAHFPVALIAIEGGEPDIEVDPAEVTSTQAPDTVVTETLTIENVGTADLTWDIVEDDGPTVPLGGWSDNFDSYATGSQIHGQGGWKGWFDDINAGAFVTDTEALSSPNSVDIQSPTDLVHEYTGYNTGFWTYTAWVYVPSDLTSTSYFILLNKYDDAGADLNWSVTVTFEPGSGQVENTGASGGTLPLITDEWVQLRVEIDLINDIQEFYYDGQLLYTGTWTDEISGDGDLNIGAVDLYAESASSVFYDDLSLVAAVPDACELPNDISWLAVDPDNGTTAAGGSDDVSVGFDSTGLSTGVYTGTLCVNSNDPIDPLVQVPVTLTVEEPAAADVTLTKTVGTTPGECATTDSITLPLGTDGTPVVYCYVATNTGGDILSTHGLTDTVLGTISLPSGGVFDLGPSESVTVTQVYTITQVGTLTNCATWTSTVTGGPTVTGSDCAEVEIQAATGVSLTSLSGGGPVAWLPALLAALLLLALAGAMLLRRRNLV